MAKHAAPDSRVSDKPVNQLASWIVGAFTATLVALLLIMILVAVVSSRTGPAPTLFH